METMNFTQFCDKNGFPSDYDMQDHADLSPSGKASKASRKAAEQRLAARISENGTAHRFYQKAIDRGEVVDPSGEYTPTPKDKTPAVIFAKSRIAQLESRIQILSKVGVSLKTQKIRPTYQKEMEKAKDEILGLKRLTQ